MSHESIFGMPGHPATWLAGGRAVSPQAGGQTGGRAAGGLTKLLGNIFFNLLAPSRWERVSSIFWPTHQMPHELTP